MTGLFQPIGDFCCQRSIRTNVMKGIKLLFALSLVIFSCTDDDTKNVDCTDNPAENLSWLKAEIDIYDHVSTFYDILVHKTTYQGNDVIVLVLCCPSCDTMPPEVKKCNGQVVGRLGVEIDASILQGGTIVWRTNNGICP
jgi:hypothetical protein